MTPQPLTSFIADVDGLDDPHAIGERLAALLAEDGWLAPEHREPDRRHYRAVTAVADEPTVSIHVYGADIEARGTSVYRRYDDWPILRAALPAAV
jgi:hypothetical protein